MWLEWSLVEAEWWVLVSHQGRVGRDAKRPAVDAHHEVEKTAWVPSGEEKRNRRESHRETEQRTEEPRLPVVRTVGDGQSGTPAPEPSTRE